MSIFPSSLEERCSSTYWLPIKTDGIYHAKEKLRVGVTSTQCLNSVCGEQRNRIVGHCND